MKETLKQENRSQDKTAASLKQSDELNQVSNQEKCSTKITKKLVPKQMKQFDKWTLDENILYVRFVKSNKKILLSNGNLKKSKKFEKMSQCILSKSSNQCKSHHQKLMKRFQTIQRIIKQYLPILRSKQNKFYQEENVCWHTQPTKENIQQRQMNLPFVKIQEQPEKYEYKITPMGFQCQEDNQVKIQEQKPSQREKTND